MDQRAMNRLASSKEIREGWPLLTDETEVNGDSKSTNERGPSLVGSLGLSCQYKILFSCLGCSSRPSTKYFFLAVYYFNSFVPIDPLPGQAVVLCRLSISVCVSGSLPHTLPPFPPLPSISTTGEWRHTGRLRERQHADWRGGSQIIRQRESLFRYKPLILSDVNSLLD